MDSDGDGLFRVGRRHQGVAHDRGHLRLQLMIAPGHDAPELPPFAQRSTLIGHNLMTVIAKGDAAVGIKWAEQVIALSYAMLAAWTAAAWAGTAWVVARRR
jgi:hypothetical protein